MLTAFFVCVLGTMIYAQTSRASFEISGGPGFSMISGVTNPPDKYGFQIGLFSDIRISKLISIHTGISFDRKGSKYSSMFLHDYNNREVENLDLNFDYFSVPLVVRLTFQKPFKFFINSGVYGSRLHSTMLISHGIYEGFICYNLTPFIPEYDFGLVNGLGIIIPLYSQIAFTAEIRNNRGLTNVKGDPDYLWGSGTPRARTNLTTLLVGISIRLGK
jgi:hypothetical protein